MIATLKVTLTIPPIQLRPNGRAHYMTKAKLTKRHRAESMMLATIALAGQPAPRWSRAMIRPIFHTTRAWDPDNAIASIKAPVDGLRDAGIILNDDNGRVFYAAPEFVKAKPGQTKLEIIVEPSHG